MNRLTILFHLLMVLMTLMSRKAHTPSNSSTFLITSPYPRHHPKLPLKVLATKKAVSISERQMWIVIRKAYPKNALDTLRARLGNENPVFLTLKEEVEKGTPNIILYR